jgi:hypothetical protein
MAGRCLPGAAEQKVQIFCLPGFVEDLLLAVSLPRCFLYVRDPSMVSVLQCMDQEELSHLSQHMDFRNTDGERTCTRKETQIGTRVMKETKKERKRKRKNQRSFPFAFCGPTFFDLKEHRCLSCYFLFLSSVQSFWHLTLGFHFLHPCSFYRQ